MDKKQLANAKNDYALHVALIMKSDACTKGAASFKAWLEGEAGLKTRLTNTATVTPTQTK